MLRHYVLSIRHDEPEPDPTVYTLVADGADLAIEGGVVDLDVVPAPGDLPVWRGNEPAGMTQRAHETWAGRTIPVSNDAAISGSAWRVGNPNGNLTRITDETVPGGAGTCLRMVYPSGLTGGSRPGTMYISMPAVREWYVCQWVKWSTDWEWNTTSQKHFYALHDTNIHIQVRWGGTQIFSLYNQLSENPVLNTNNPAAPDDDTWHLLEWHCDLVEGRSSHWLDGNPLLIGAAINNGNTLFEFQIDSTWGGSGGPKSQTDYRYDGPVYISYRAA